MARNIRCVLAIVALSLVPFAGRTHAAGGPQVAPVRTVRLQVSPTPEPRFALQYLFATPYLEQERGNAAFLYQTAVGQMMQMNSGDQAIDGDTLKKWLDDPIENLDLGKVRSAIARFDPTFRLLEAAAGRERCTWEYPIRQEGLQYMSPLLSEYRRLFRLVAVKAKLEIHDGDFDTALNTLRSAILFARGVGDGPNLIQHLVGVSMAAGTLRQIEAWIEQPAAPNMYWALTALPTPLVDIRNAVRMESEALLAELPELLTLEEAVLPNEKVLDLWRRAIAMLGGDSENPGRWLGKTVMIAGAMRRYSQAKARLLEEGHAAEKVEAWPALYAIVLDQYQQFRAVRDQSFKWTHVPYTHARQGLKQADEEMSQLWRQDGATMANPFLAFLPATQRISFLGARLAREIAILRCVEAIRMYAAEHDGKLPKSLADITAVPVPSDPLNGRAFHYELTGGKAILESAVPPEGGPKDGLRYEITLR